MATVAVSTLIDKMELTNLTPEIDVQAIKIAQPDINRPALQLAGFFDHYEATRLQVIGFVEYKYMTWRSIRPFSCRLSRLISSLPTITRLVPLRPDSTTTNS